MNDFSPVIYKHIVKTVGLAKNKNQERLIDFRKQDIELVFVDAKKTPLNWGFC